MCNASHNEVRTIVHLYTFCHWKGWHETTVTVRNQHSWLRIDTYHHKMLRSVGLHAHLNTKNLLFHYKADQID